MMTKLLPGFLIGLILLPLQTSWAWGPVGHKIVGEIAQMHLLPSVKTKIRENFNIKRLADVANWADRVRKKRSQGPWHYCNIEAGEWKYDKNRDCPDGICVVEKVRYFVKILQEGGLPKKKRREALMYLVHFVGDIHQPLHLGNARDRGGNTIRFFFQGERTNLHALWDGRLIHLGGKNLLQYARDLHRRIESRDINSWTRASVTDWANESRAVALNHAYVLGNAQSPRVSKNYIERSRDIIDLRLSQAGVRLADLLNTILK